MARVPTGAREYFNHLVRTKEALEHGELENAQRAIAKQILTKNSLTMQRRQYIADMVAAGYTDEEIKLTLVSPESPLNILVSILSPKEANRKIQREIRNARREIEESGVTARRRAYVRQRNQLLELAWEAVSTAGATHRKPLLELVERISQDLAEAEGLVSKRAGRAHSRRPVNEADRRAAPDRPKPLEADPDNITPEWEGEFVPDDEDEDSDQE